MSPTGSNPLRDEADTTRRWVTVEEVLAAKAAFESAIPGWRRPASYALGVSVGSAPLDWRVINHPNTHELPAVVLATVLGHRSGSATYWLTRRQLDEAICLLEPAGACREFDHPNLWAWQRLARELDEREQPDAVRIAVVFLDSTGHHPTDDTQRQLLSVLSDPLRAD